MTRFASWVGRIPTGPDGGLAPPPDPLHVEPLDNLRRLFLLLASLNAAFVAVLVLVASRSHAGHLLSDLGITLLLIGWLRAMRLGRFGVEAEAWSVAGWAMVGIGGAREIDAVTMLGLTLVYRGAFPGGGAGRSHGFEGFPWLSALLYFGALIAGGAAAHGGITDLGSDVTILAPIAASGVVLGRMLARSDVARTGSLHRERVLNEAAHCFAELPQLDAIQDNALRACAQLLEGHSDARVILFSYDNGQLTPTGIHGRDAADTATWPSLPLVDVLAEAFERRSSFALGPEEMAKLGSLLRQKLSPYAILLPLRADNRRLGLLSVGFTSNLPAETVEGLELLAAELAVAWYNAVLTDEIMHQAEHDSLTGLANRSAFLKHLDELGSGHRVPGSRGPDRRGEEVGVSVLFVDLDGMKQINDDLGHAAGDAILVAAAQRIRGCLRAGDLAARLGGDEFAVAISSGRDPGVAMVVADRIVRALDAPMRIEGMSIRCTASIGVATAAVDDLSTGRLLQAADTAMYAAKRQGRNRVVCYEPGFDLEARNRMLIMADLERALAESSLEVHFQPVFALGEIKLRGFEALARWHGPGGDPIPPSVFIPVAEQTGLIVALGRWVLAQSCSQLARWRREYGLDPQVSVAVNVSIRELEEPDYIDAVKAAITDFGLRPEDLVLEVTESLLMAEGHPGIGRLGELHDFGVRLSIDDFGTGWSALSRLTTFPAHQLKIDRAFVQDLGSSPSAETMARAIITMAHGLAMRVVAEGVETPGQAEWLAAHGCDKAQGYLYGYPRPGAFLDSELERGAGVLAPYASRS